MARSSTVALASLLVPLVACIGSDRELSSSEVNVTSSCPGEPVLVESIEIVNGQLNATVGHGGCNAAAVWACWNGAFLESFPVQAHLAIHHAPAGNCDAFFTQTVSLSLEPVLDAYVDGYHRVDPIVLHVGGKSETWQP